MNISFHNVLHVKCYYFIYIHALFRTQCVFKVVYIYTHRFYLPKERTVITYHIYMYIFVIFITKQQNNTQYFSLFMIFVLSDEMSLENAINVFIIT